MKKLLLLLPMLAIVSMHAADPNPQEQNSNAVPATQVAQFMATVTQLNAQIVANLQAMSASHTTPARTATGRSY